MSKKDFAKGLLAWVVIWSAILVASAIQYS